MGCQKTIARTIVEQEEDYVRTRKANHGRLYEEVQRFFDWAQRCQFAEVPHGIITRWRSNMGGWKSAAIG
jgi:predicted transposase YbfD/YdcC